jgi:hypothetical protein
MLARPALMGAPAQGRTGDLTVMERTDAATGAPVAARFVTCGHSRQADAVPDEGWRCRPDRPTPPTRSAV